MRDDRVQLRLVSLVVAWRKVFVIADDLFPSAPALLLSLRPTLLAILIHWRQRLIQTGSASDGRHICTWEPRVGHVAGVRGIEHLLHLNGIDVDPGTFLVVCPCVGEHLPDVVAEASHDLVLVRIDTFAYVRECDGGQDDAVVVRVFALVGQLAEEVAPLAPALIGAVRDRLVTLIECLLHALPDSCRQFESLELPSFLHDCQENNF
jgi:hypothetical protein